MNRSDRAPDISPAANPADAAAIAHFRQSITEGKHWFTVLL